MRDILFIHHFGLMGGAGLSLLHILKQLQDSPDNITVYCPNSPDHIIKEIKKMGYKTISTPKKIPIFEHFSGCDRFILNYKTLKNFYKIKKNKSQIKNMIREINPDIVVVNSMTTHYIGKIAKELNKKTVCFHRESYAKGLFGLRTNYIKKNLSEYFDKVIFISKYDYVETGYLKSQSQILYDKVTINDYQLLTNNYKNLEEKEGKRINVLFTGGMSSLKGAHVIIKALGLCKSNVHLIFLQYEGLERKKVLTDYKGFKGKLKFILGKDYSAKILSLIHKENLWDRIHFYPSTNDVAYYFNMSDIVVFPSTSPHQARPIYEAGAANKPIIITASKNISEFVIHNKNGFLFHNNNYIQLAKYIDRLAIDPQLRNRLGNENYRMTTNKHDFNKLKEELSKVFSL